jgi:hypothetical protein
VPLHKLWHERYVLVEAMLPCFVSAALGEQVLLTLTLALALALALALILTLTLTPGAPRGQGDQLHPSLVRR